MPTIYGSLERITYYNEENNFVVARLQEKGKKGLTTIVGNLVSINPGESLKLTGKWVHNKKFGEQFKIETCEVTVPATVNGIKKYLGSGLIRGIGPIMADRIVSVFGLDTLDVIENSPEGLAEVDGIGQKRIAMITEAWEEQKEIKDIMIFLQGHGVSATYSSKIYKRYGKESIKVVKDNPYRLATDIQGIGFLTADKIAQYIGVDARSVIRTKAGVIYTLNDLTNEGHVYYPYDALLQKTSDLLDVDKDIVVRAISELSSEKQIVLEDFEDHKAVYLAAFHVAEAGISNRLKMLRDSSSLVRPIKPEKALEWVQNRLGIRLAERQKEAVSLATNSKVLIITGGPGTGKTTIIKAILKIFQQLKLQILLAAPTGRAAKRMEEATSFEARTIHRLLEYSFHKGGFQKNQDHPLDAHVVIIDEASMIDVLLMYHLLKAIPPHAHLILVGDVNQLPSVGPGNTLKDTIESRRYHIVTLTEIFRQAEKSMIVVNAHKVNRGEFPFLSNPDSEELTDFYFIVEEDPEKILNKIIRLCKERIPRRFGYHPVKDIQVLTPMHRGIIGASNLNLELQRHLNHSQSSMLHGSRVFKLGDKVMQIANNYEKEVFNGDIGWVLRIDEEEHKVEVDYDGRKVKYEYSELDEIILAYAVSVHKSQGSEYPVVVIPVVTQHYMLLQRNLIYTAITRAKRLVVLIGTKKALAIAIKNNKVGKRYTYLKQRLAVV
jgi:exodeoxyribonuclease V alpha subunit